MAMMIMIIIIIIKIKNNNNNNNTNSNTNTTTTNNNYNNNENVKLWSDDKCYAFVENISTLNIDDNNRDLAAFENMILIQLMT